MRPNGSNYSIIGYSARGRMPLNHALRAGQFQSARLGSVNIWAGAPHTTVNNYYLDDGYYNYEEPQMSGLMKWAMGLSISGGILGALGQIITAWGGSSKGSGEVEGKGSSESTDTTKQDLAVLKDSYKEYAKISGPMSDGSYIVTPKGGKPTSVKDYNALKEMLNDLATASEKQPEVVPRDAVTTTVKPKDDTETQTKEEVFAGLQKALPGLTDDMLKNKGIEFVNGHYEKAGKVLSEDDIYEAITGNKPLSKDFDLSSINNNLIGVYDDGKNSNGKEIGDFKNAKMLSYDSKTGIAKIGNHTYKVVSQDSKYMYLEDTNPRGGATNNRQVYVLEKNGNTYELHQRELLGSTLNPGLGKAAHY